MGTHILTTLALVASLALATHGFSNKFNMNHLCALVNDGLMISSLDACDAYYECQGGKAARRICPTNSIFSKEHQSCMPQDQVQCAISSSVPCSGYTVGSWAPVAGSCTDFYYCSQTGPMRASCPYGEYFNPVKQACVYPGEYPCSGSSTGMGVDTDISIEDGSGEAADGSSISITITLPLNLCNFIPNGIFFGSPSACSGWNKCVDNVLQSGICANGMEYNVLTMMCEYPQVVTCSQVTNDPFLVPNTCSTKNTKKAGFSCDTYMVCDGSYYQIAQCPTGEFYDTVSQQCVDRAEARNNCDRCEGSTSSFVNMYSANNCTGYLYCVNGVEVASGYCANGSYFDERVGACVMGASDPMLGCCNPQYYSSGSDSTTTANDTDGSDNTDATTEAAEKTTVAEAAGATTVAASNADGSSDASSSATSGTGTDAGTGSSSAAAPSPAA
ncbi:peritrophin-48-like [Musca vetustissima]|uniref:peritrophin-48-like n=1 Tax=Musca vetustissima TaxID=27455 RepID=UPI002AB66DC1|nr:peritrophin-48-like [Musca vetustissima]